jgi:hypothetical protein
MIIIKENIPRQELARMAAEGFGDMVKGVVDIAREWLALDAELHADLEALLLEEGSRQMDLWGVNLYPEMQGDDFLEYDSMINLRPSQGNRTRGVEDEATRRRIREIVAKRVLS